ncbi:MAG: amidohydrolase family protein [Bacteroidales bacterium]|nr:amidohydrolase family protein [Bacteroidales bacterium]
MKLDIHTHAFTADDLGGNYIKIINTWLERRIEKSWLLRLCLRLLNPFSSSDKLEYTANFLREQAKSTEQKVSEWFKFINHRYKGEDWGLNILTVDFDYMKRGTPKRKFEAQLKAALAEKYRDAYRREHVKVYMGIDPRRPDLYELIAKYINQVDGFKLYCYNGFFPYDERLNLFYQICESHKKPVLFHCSDTNINYYGGSDIKELLKKSKFILLSDRKRTSNKDLSTNFCNPAGYELVIKNNPNVNFIIAHWGGCKLFRDMVTRIGITYKNGFIDPSFFAAKKENQDYMLDMFHKFPILKEKVLFGSDTPMIEIEGGKGLIYKMDKVLIPETWEKVTTNWEKLYN